MKCDYPHGADANIWSCDLIESVKRAIGQQSNPGGGTADCGLRIADCGLAAIIQGQTALALREGGLGG